MLEWLKEILPWKRYNKFIVKNPGRMPPVGRGPFIEYQVYLGMPRDWVEMQADEIFGKD